MLKALRTVSLGSNLLPLLLSKTSLGDSLDPAPPAASCVDKALAWETGQVGSDPSSATHPVQTWASGFPSLGLPVPICMEEREPRQVSILGMGTSPPRMRSSLIQDSSSELRV